MVGKIRRQLGPALRLESSNGESPTPRGSSTCAPQVPPRPRHSGRPRSQNCASAPCRRLRDAVASSSPSILGDRALLGDIVTASGDEGAAPIQDQDQEGNQFLIRPVRVVKSGRRAPGAMPDPQDGMEPRTGPGTSHPEESHPQALTKLAVAPLLV